MENRTEKKNRTSNGNWLKGGFGAHSRDLI